MTICRQCARRFSPRSPSGTRALRVVSTGRIATALVAALSQALLDEGRQRLFLITDLANPVSNSIYAKIGYRPQSDLFHFDFLAA